MQNPTSKEWLSIAWQISQSKHDLILCWFVLNVISEPETK